MLQYEHLFRADHPCWDSKCVWTEQDWHCVSVLPKEGKKKAKATDEVLSMLWREKLSKETEIEWKKRKDTMCATNYGYIQNQWADNLRNKLLSRQSGQVTQTQLRYLHKTLSLSPRETQTIHEMIVIIFRSVWLNSRSAMLALLAFGSLRSQFFSPRKKISLPPAQCRPDRCGKQLWMGGEAW